MSRIAMIALLSLSLLSGCGVRPDDVDPPPGAGERDFPRTYPDLSTDPGILTPPPAR